MRARREARYRECGRAGSIPALRSLRSLAATAVPPDRGAGRARARSGRGSAGRQRPLPAPHRPPARGPAAPERPEHGKNPPAALGLLNVAVNKRNQALKGFFFLSFFLFFNFIFDGRSVHGESSTRVYPHALQTLPGELAERLI